MHCENLFSTPYNSEGWQLYYYYSPLFATLLAPFTLLPTFIITHDVPFGLFILKIVWNCFNVYFIYKLYSSVKLVFNPPRNKQGLMFWIILALVSYRWVFLNLLYGQMTVLIVWGVVRVFANPIKLGWKQLWGLALGVNIKILPIFIVGQFFLMRWWKAFLVTTALVIAMILLPYLYLPWGYHTEILESWMLNINPFSKSHVVELGEGGFIDFGALVTKYLTGLNVLGEDRVDWFSLSPTGVFWWTQCFRLLVLGTCMFWINRIEKCRIDHWEFLTMSVFLASIPLAFPHQRDYSIFMMWPMIVILIQSWIFGLLIIPKWLKFALIFSGLWLGVIIFFEALPFDWRIFITGYRIQGIGALLLWICMQLFLWLNFGRRNSKS